MVRANYLRRALRFARSLRRHGRRPDLLCFAARSCSSLSCRVARRCSSLPCSVVCCCLLTLLSCILAPSHSFIIIIMSSSEEAKDVEMSDAPPVVPPPVAVGVLLACEQRRREPMCAARRGTVWLCDVCESAKLERACAKLPQWFQMESAGVLPLGSPFSIRSGLGVACGKPAPPRTRLVFVRTIHSRAFLFHSRCHSI